MPRCPSCGQESPAASAFCAACGASLKPPGPAELAEANRLLDLLRQGQKIEAIKQYRQATGAGLKDSKEAVERLAAENGIEIPTMSGSGALLVVGLALAVLGAVVAWYLLK